MKFKRLKKECVVFNKTNGKYYIAHTVEEEFGVLTPYDKDAKMDLDGPEVKITQDNDLCFRLIHDPNPPEVPTGYTVDDNGILKKQGEKVTEQGTLLFDKILCAQPGYLVLATKTKDRKENEVDIFIYFPYQDRFKKIAGGVAANLTHNGYAWDFKGEKTTGNDFDIFTFFCSHTEKVEVDGEEVEKEKYDKSGIFILHDQVITNIYPDGDIVEVQDKVEFAETPYGVDVIFKGGRKIDEKGFMTDEPDNQYIFVQVVNCQNDKNKTAVDEDARVYEFEEIKAVTFCHLHGHEGTVIFGDNKLVTDELKFNLPADIFNTVVEKGLTILVDARVEGKEMEVALTNREMTNVIRILATYTRDRGTVTKIL